MTRMHDSAPLARLLALSAAELAGRLMDALHEAGFDDQRLAHNNVFPHIPRDGIRLTDLAERGSMTKQAMSELVLDLERLGYLQREADPADRRARLITFTDRGWTAIAAARVALRAIEDDLVARLGAERIDELRETLTEILQD